MIENRIHIRVAVSSIFPAEQNEITIGGKRGLISMTRGQAPQPLTRLWDECHPSHPSWQRLLTDYLRSPYPHLSRHSRHFHWKHENTLTWSSVARCFVITDNLIILRLKYHQSHKNLRRHTLTYLWIRKIIYYPIMARISSVSSMIAASDKCLSEVAFPFTSVDWDTWQTLISMDCGTWDTDADIGAARFPTLDDRTYKSSS